MTGWTREDRFLSHMTEEQELRDTLQTPQHSEVLLVPGGVFMINSSEPCAYVRAAFSQSTPEQIDEAFRRLSLLIKEAV